MAILVTGAAGFVMSSVVRELASRGHAVVAADRNPPDAALRRHLGGLRGDVTFRTIDVADRDAVRALIADVRPERAVHGAAITAIPPEAERARFVETTRVNVDGTLHVLDALRDAGTARIIAVSSGSVYGPRDGGALITEDDAKNPDGLYPITKWSADQLARRFAAVHGLDLAVARLASPFGPFERDTGSRPLLSPIERWATAALRGEPIVAGGRPSFTRDAVYVDDIGDALAALLLAPRLAHDAYNVGWGRGTTAEETLAALAKLVPGLRYEFRADAPWPWSGSTRPALDVTRLRKDIGWSPRYDLESGLAAYLAWLRQGV